MSRFGILIVAVLVGTFGLGIYSASQPQPPRWETKCVASHEEPYMSMETSISGSGVPGGAYPVIRYTSVCDRTEQVCKIDSRWTKTPNRCPRRKG